MKNPDVTIHSEHVRQTMRELAHKHWLDCGVDLRSRNSKHNEQPVAQQQFSAQHGVASPGFGVL